MEKSEDAMGAAAPRHAGLDHADHDLAAASALEGVAAVGTGTALTEAPLGPDLGVLDSRFRAPAWRQGVDLREPWSTAALCRRSPPWHRG